MSIKNKTKVKISVRIPEKSKVMIEKLADHREINFSQYVLMSVQNQINADQLIYNPPKNDLLADIPAVVT